MKKSDIEKIFIDPNDEITLVIERLSGIDSQFVVCIAPVGSQIFTSFVSLKVFFYESLSLAKIPILVTEDDYGYLMAKRAGFVVVRRVNEITTPLWELATNKLMEYKRYLTQRHIEHHNIEFDFNRGIDSELLPVVSDIKKDGLSLNDDEKIIKANGVEEDVNNRDINYLDKKTSTDENEDFSKVNFGKVTPIKNNTTKDVSPKKVNLNGIDIFIGSDVFEEEDDGAKIYNINDDNKDMSIKNIKAGKDFTSSFLNRKNKNSVSVKNILFGDIKAPEDREVIQKTSALKLLFSNRIFISLFTFIVLLLIGFYVFINFFVTVIVTLDLKPENTLAETRITISPEVEEVNVEKYIIPSESINNDSISKSVSAEASGVGKVGTKAKGFIYIVNKTRDSIVLEAGTEFTHNSSSLVYELINDIKIPSGSVADDGSTDPERLDGVALRAKEPGKEFNITLSDGNLFTIEGFDDFSVLEAKLEQSFEGGESTNTTVVSKEDFEKLKEKVVPDIKKEAIEKFKELYSSRSDLKLIDESIIFKEDKITSFPEIGAEVKDENKSFTVNVSGKVTAYAIKTKDIDKIVGVVLKSNDDSSQIKGVKNVKFSEVTQTNEKDITLMLRVEGSKVVDINKDEIFLKIKGLNPVEAESVLSKEELVVSAKVGYSPFFMPDFLRFIPSDLNKIEFRIK